MARATRTEQREHRGGGAAGRVAARRRDARPTERRSGGRGPAPKSRGSGARLFKLGLLIGAFMCIGFFAVLVVDVSIGLLGSWRMGDTTISALWDKVVARMLDEDVPRVDAPVRARAAKRSPPPRSAQPLEPPRAPVKVAAPEEDARHVDVRPRRDPEVERAKQRLDDILGRL